ncbi:hypothetical protein F1880_009622 [Penicillium rolfsii]|nr:hypothetical protein F1880_009622 [Penicillium rolfsii]
MGVALVGNSKPIVPLTLEELSRRLEDQKAIYAGVSVYLKHRGSQPLETSMFANAKSAGHSARHSTGHSAGSYSGNYSGKPAAWPVAQSAGSSVQTEPLKNLQKDDKHYVNITHDDSNNAGRPVVATTQGSFKLSIGTAKNNGAAKAAGKRQVYNGLKNSEAIFELAARINAERAEREVAKLLEESMNTATVNSLDTPKIDTPKTFYEPQNIGELNNINAPKAYNGLQDFDTVKEIAVVVNAQMVDEEKDELIVIKTIDAPKTVIESQSFDVNDPKNLNGANNANERKDYTGPQDFNAVKEAAARIHAHRSAPKNIHEPINSTAVKTLEIPKISVESKSPSHDKSLNGSIHAPQNLHERKSLTEPMTVTTSGTNPKAQAFVPASRYSSNPGQANPGLTNNDEWMAHAKGFFSKGGFGSKHSGSPPTIREPLVKREPATRVLLLKNVPDWMNLSDAISLIHGGAIDCIFRSEMTEITVKFCDEAACKAYLDAYPNGIMVHFGDSTEVTINVEKAPRGEDIPPPLQVKIASGGSRLVRVEGMLDAAAIQALTASAMEYDVDHVEFRAEKNKDGSVYFFFCSLADGWSFRQKLKQDEDWADYTAEFTADPCKMASTFHGNTIPNRMASAVAAA